MPIPWNRLQPSAEGWLGLVGTVLYLCFGLLVFYRTIRQLVEWTTSLFTTRKMFHLALFLATCLDVPAFLEQWQDGVMTGVPYACHLFGLAFSIAQFAVCLVAWSKVLNLGERRRGLITLASVVTVLYTIYTAYVTIRLSEARTFGDFVNLDTSFHVLVAAFSLILAFMAIAALLQAIGLMCQMVTHPYWKGPDRAGKRAALMRVVVVMSTCSVLFLVRVALLTWLFVSLALGRGNNFMNPVVWMVFAWWLPFLAPGLALLHLMRRTHRPGTNSTIGATTKTLLPSYTTNTNNSIMASPIVYRSPASTRGEASVGTSQQSVAYGSLTHGDPLGQVRRLTPPTDGGFMSSYLPQARSQGPLLGANASPNVSNVRASPLRPVGTGSLLLPPPSPARSRQALATTLRQAMPTASLTRQHRYQSR